MVQVPCLAESFGRGRIRKRAISLRSDAAFQGLVEASIGNSFICTDYTGSTTVLRGWQIMFDVKVWG